MMLTMQVKVNAKKIYCKNKDMRFRENNFVRSKNLLLCKRYIKFLSETKTVAL